MDELPARELALEARQQARRQRRTVPEAQFRQMGQKIPTFVGYAPLR
jgi:hypothetical protein